MIVMPTFFPALDIAHSKKDKWIRSPSHFSFLIVFSSFRCCLSAKVIKGITPKIRMLCLVKLVTNL